MFKWVKFDDGTFLRIDPFLDGGNLDCLVPLPDAKDLAECCDSCCWGQSMFPDGLHQSLLEILKRHKVGDDAILAMMREIAVRGGLHKIGSH